MSKILIFIFLCFPSLIFASSAFRSPEQDYSVYEKKVIQEEKNVRFFGRSAIRSAKLFDESNLSKAQVWKSHQVMQERFESIRDLRFLNTNSNFPRRISWLYPHDGCWVRAALFNRNAFRLFIPIPDKIFAFGNLRVETPNSLYGAVTWWFHVAPIVQLGEEKYVLDPSIEASRPLEITEWLSRMGTPEKIKVAICRSGTYSPVSSCDNTTDGLELNAEREQGYYLKLEKNTLQKLGRNPEQELGDNPPW